jgi:hypothetical protein
MRNLVIKSLLSSFILFAACGKEEEKPAPKPQAPEVISINPASIDENFAPNGTLSILFSEKMNTEKSEEGFQFYNSELGESFGTFTWSEGDTKLNWTPNTLLPRNTTYTITLFANSVQSVDELFLKEDFTSSIKVEPFQVLRIETLLGAIFSEDRDEARANNGIPPESSLVFTFSTAIDEDQSSCAGFIEIEDNDRNNVAFTLSFSADKRQITLTPNADFKEKERYTILVSSCLQSTIGDTLGRGLTSEYRTGEYLRITSVPPVGTNDEWMVTTSPYITFTRPMDRESVESALTIEENNQPFSMPYFLFWTQNQDLHDVLQIADDAATYSPGWSEFANIRITIKKSAKDFLGNELSEDFVLNFRTNDQVPEQPEG